MRGFTDFIEHKQNSSDYVGDDLFGNLKWCSCSSQVYSELNMVIS